jgi:hypothetical protein
LESKTLFDLVEIGPEQSIIKLSGSDKTVEVRGSVLEAQLELKNGWALILTTENSPYDEALHVTLLDKNLEVLDQVELSEDMTPGIVADIKIIDGERLQFMFNRANPYVFRVDINGFLLPKGSEYAKRDFARKFGKKYLHISGRGMVSSEDCRYVKNTPS